MARSQFSNPTSFGQASSVYSSSSESMYKINVPQTHKPSQSTSSSSGLKVVLGKIDNSAKKLHDASAFSLLECSRLFLNNILNPLTIGCIFLAVCSSVYSRIGQCFLQASAGISDTRAYAIPYVAAAVQEHAIGSLNATVYNLMNSAQSQLSSLQQAYTNAQLDICKTMNVTTSNQTSKSISAFSKRAAQQITITDPYKWASQHCGTTQKQDIASSGLSAIAAISRTMVQNVTSLSKIRVPAVNITSYNNTDFINLDLKVRNTGIAWISVFSIFSVIFVFLYWFYDYSVCQFGTEERVEARIEEYALDAKNGVEYSIPRKLLQNWGYYCGAVYRFLKTKLMSGAINRLLYSSFVLILLGLSCSTILSSIHLKNLEEHSAMDQQWFTSLQNAYSLYESDVNNKSITYIGTFIRSLNDNHMLMNRQLSETYQFTISTMAPFQSGVAVNVMSLPLVGTNKLPDRVLVPGGSIHTLTTMMEVVQNLSKGCWISGIVLFAIWVVCTAGYLFFSI